MAESARDFRKRHYATLSLDRATDDVFLQRLIDQLNNLANNFNNLVDVTCLEINDSVEYKTRPMVLGKELSDPGIVFPQFGIAVNGPIAAYDARGDGNKASFVQKSSFASAAILNRGQSACEAFISASITTSTIAPIPDYAIIKGIAVMVTAHPGGTSHFTIKTSAGTTFSGTIASVLNTKSVARSNCPYQAGASENLQILFDTAPADGEGKIELVMFTELISQS